MVTKSYSINKDTEEQLNYIHSTKDLKYSDIIRRAVEMYYNKVMEEDTVPANIFKELESKANTNFNAAQSLVVDKFGADLETIGNRVVFVLKEDEKTGERVVNIRAYVNKIAHKHPLIAYCFRYHGKNNYYDVLTGDLLDG